MFNFEDIVSFSEYAEKAGISLNAVWRRININTKNKIQLSEFEIEEIKKLPTNRYNNELATAIRKNEKVKLISLKENPPKSRPGRPFKK